MGHLTTGSATLLREYTLKPKPLMAVQLTEDNAVEVARMVSGKLLTRNDTEPLRIYFHCCNGRVKAEWGDWIIRDKRGFTTMSNEDFISTHQEKQ